MSQWNRHLLGTTSGRSVRMLQWNILVLGEAEIQSTRMSGFNDSCSLSTIREGR